MHSADEKVESLAEMIARLVCEYEDRQAATKAKKSIHIDSIHRLTSTTFSSSTST
ncbi:hypothetical protein [Scytonema hofmannii]|uniref:hypothetical protein n=1 Tax=Scytonema hofmannii TaxID=34078 RepID=UPI00034B56D8|nr:hypothetical protein [Scytonema hofmannii]